MDRRTLAACLAIAAPFAVGIWHHGHSAPQVALSAPLGTYDSRDSALDAAAQMMRNGRCVRLEPVDDQETELQPC